jgi:hypothetical protein
MKLSLALALWAGTAAWAADPVPMDVKTGQWETTVTSQMSGLPQAAQKMPAIPPEQLAQLPPEQRARIEAALKQAGAPRTTTSKTCVKKTDLAKLNVNNDQNKNCKTTLVNSSRTRQELHMDCDINGAKQTGAIVIEALNSESIKFNVQVAAGNSGPPMNVTINGTSKWLGATCTDAK